MIAIPDSDPDTLGALEEQVLLALDPPLILSKVPSSPVRQRLTELRSQYGR